MFQRILDLIREPEPGKGIKERLTAIIAIITIITSAIGRN